MTRFLAAAALLAALASGGVAQALSLTNDDDASYAVTVVTSDDMETTIELAPSQTIDDICMDGCTLNLENGASQEFEGGDAVAIVDGALSLLE